MYLNSETLDRDLAYAVEKSIDWLVIDPRRGWNRSGLESLAGINFTSLEIWDMKSESLSGLLSTASVSRLVLNGGGQVDLSRISGLRSFSGDWSPKLRLQHCGELTELHLWKLSSKASCRELPSVATLEIVQSNIVSLDGLPANKIRHFEAAYLPKLSNVTALKESKIEVFVANRCKQLSLELVPAMKTMTEITLLHCKPIKTLASILDAWPNLQAINLYGTDVEDGNLEPLRRLKKPAH